MSVQSSATTKRSPPGHEAASAEAAGTRSLEPAALVVFLVVYAAGAYVMDIDGVSRQWWTDGAWTMAALATWAAPGRSGVTALDWVR